MNLGMMLGGLAALLAVGAWLAHRRGRIWLVLGAVACAATGALVWYATPRAVPGKQASASRSKPEPPPESPALGLAPRQDGGFVSAAVCQDCHPRQHASWHDSYHCTMTQRVTPESVLADFTPRALRARDRTFRLWRDDGLFLVDMIDPEWEDQQRALGREVDSGQAPRVQRPLVMSTGSHHFQTYWIHGEQGRELWQFPWVYHLAEARWLPAEDAFISPPDAPPRVARWNDNCIQCHAVGGQPGLEESSGQFSSRVVDLGIACEACHGPGEQHVAEQRRAATGSRPAAADAAPSIVNPARLSHERASQVCGQCHSYFSFGEASFWQTGFTYRAGDDLHATRMIHTFDQVYVQQRPDLLAGYWDDGTMRIAGREFSALDDSACFQRGEISCLSCHAMHGYEAADDQLAPGMREDQACLQCHPTYREQLTRHTHHAAESAGSRCYNCHMPHTSFGLLKGIRSHRIDSPTARMTAEHGRPNACNLCHADRTLAWTADLLQAWYQQPRPELTAEDQNTAASLQLLLRGDAVQRAVVAWNLGQPAAREVSDSWQPPFLALTLLDTYSAVRFAAFDALRQFPGFEKLEFDFLAPPEQRQAAMQRIVEQWRASLPDDPQWARPELLLRPDGTMRVEQVQELMQRRDQRPLLLPE